MTILEPMTVATDYLLGAVTAWLAFLLFNTGQKSRLFWAIAFTALALGAVLGGTWHGFAQSELLWKATVLAVGVASFAMLAGSAYAALGPRVRNAVVIAAALKFLLYAGWMIARDDFIYVIADTGSALLGVAILHLVRLNGWMLAGVVVSVAAGLAQASGFDLHRHFNHNDLYHVIQLVAMFLLYRGARALRDY